MHAVAPSDTAAWVLRELIDRIRAFSFHPELVPRVLPWASAPYFSNADEQSLLNDVLASAITQQPCFIFSTAIMEVKCTLAMLAIMSSAMPLISDLSRPLVCRRRHEAQPHF